MNVTITGNSASWGGGGILCDENCSLELENVSVSENTTEGSGGGIWCADNSNLLLENVTLVQNTAGGRGGGIRCADSSSLTLENSTVSQNTVGEHGGGISCVGHSTVVLGNSTVSDNIATHRGGGLECENSDVSIIDCNLMGNECQNLVAGGIFCEFDDPSDTFFVSITNTSVESNLSTGGIGGVYIGNSESVPVNVVIEDCEFVNNVASGLTGLDIRGIGVDFSVSNCVFIGNQATNYTAGGSFGSNSTGTVSNCLLASNAAATGGGDYGSGGANVWGGANVDFMNCTFADNSAASGAGLAVGGGGIASATNCIFWGNSEDQIALSMWENQGGTLTVNYCDVQGGMDSVNVTDPASTLNWGIGNIDVDPAFADSEGDDYHLLDASPCIGAGTDSIQIDGTWYYAPSTDLEGNPRPNPPGSNPDMGAYESELGIPIMSLTGTLSDSLLVLEWTPCSGAAAYWTYGVSNDAYFQPGLVPPYEHRLAVLPPWTTTWSSSNGIGDPENNWTYLVIAVDDADLEMMHSNYCGEHDFEGEIP
jgi:predicted outer membrane repeat protein